MNEEQSVSRRATLKGLGVVGAAMVIGGAAPAAAARLLSPGEDGQDKQATNPVDVAADRFQKGFS